MQVQVESAQDVVEADVHLSDEQLGLETPVVPGDVTLCGGLPKAAVTVLAQRFAAWIFCNPPESPTCFAKEIEEGKAKLSLCHFPMPPSEEQAEAIIQSIDALPRPLMIQCSTGMRAGAALLYWLSKRRGYSIESMKQLAVDTNIRFYNKCTRCGPMKEWLLARMPEQGAGGAKLAQISDAGSLIMSQLFDPETSTFTYLLGCIASKEAVLIDPVLEQKDRDLTAVSELGLTLRHVLNTHAHADHITSGGLIRKQLPEVRTVISRASGAKADVFVDPGDKVSFGSFALQALATPGHTSGCITWYLEGTPPMVFTGDALLIRGCGRTDFQQGDAGLLYDSVHQQIFSLPGETLVYPGHDYKGRSVSTVDEERRFNSRLTKSKDDFIKLMSELNLPYPKQMDKAVPANLVCGVQDD